MRILHDYTVIANALYAKNTTFLSYEDINAYGILLYQELIKKYKVSPEKPNASTIRLEINDQTFIKDNKGVSSLYKLNRGFIDSINSSYPKGFIEIIDTSRDKYSTEYTEKGKRKRKKVAKSFD